MIEIDVNLPAGIEPRAVPDRVEQACAHQRLVAATRGTLGTYPGCVHWHFKRPGQPGTLEVTWWPKIARLWFKVAEGRDAPWVGPAIQKLKSELETAVEPQALQE